MMEKKESLCRDDELVKVSGGHSSPSAIWTCPHCNETIVTFTELLETEKRNHLLRKHDIYTG